MNVKKRGIRTYNNMSFYLFFSERKPKSVLKSYVHAS